MPKLNDPTSKECHICLEMNCEGAKFCPCECKNLYVWTGLRALLHELIQDFGQQPGGTEGVIRQSCQHYQRPVMRGRINDRCSVVKFNHVYKLRKFLVHFKAKSEATDFFEYYSCRSNTLCKKIARIYIKRVTDGTTASSEFID